MKKILNLYLLLFVMTLLVPINVFAAGSINASTNTIEVEVGEKKTFNIVSDNAYGFWKVTSADTAVAAIEASATTTGMDSKGKVLSFPVEVEGIKIGTTTVSINVSASSWDTTPVVLDKTITVSVNVVAAAVKYTVTYDANEGSVTPTNETVNQGETVTLPTPIRSGYKFLGWYNSKTNGTKVADAGVSYKPTASVTLYAQWEEDVVKPEVITYTVTYDLNGGTNGPSNQTKIEDEALTLSSKIPTRDKYEFVSWNTKKDGSGTSYLAGSKYTSNANLTLYAQWKSVESVDKNPQTGDSGVFIILAIIITFGGYTYWYTKKTKEN